MRIDPAALEAKDLYRLMISLVVPRPIAWVSTLSPAGVANAAPFSYFQALSSAPPLLMVSIGRRRGGAAKDTLANIEATREFVVNVVAEGSGERMVRTSVDHPPEVSEFDAVGLQAEPSVKVTPPRIAESPVAMECRLDRLIDAGASTVCIGAIVLFHVRDGLLEDGAADPWRLKPLARLGGSLYAPLREVVEITRDGESRVVQAELLDLWREVRAELERVEPGKTREPVRWTTREAVRAAILDDARAIGRCARR